MTKRQFAILLPHVIEGIDRLSRELSYASCNEYEMPDTAENRILWDEYQASNLGVSVTEVKTHEGYWSPTARNGQLIISDSLMVYCLKRACDLIN